MASKQNKSKRTPRPGKQNAGGLAGKSGPPGNMHGARHGLSSWLKRRALPVNKQHVARFVESYKAGLLASKGGAAGATEVERALIENASRAFGACMLVLEEAAARGFVRPLDSTWDLAPGFGRLVAFLNAERMALATLGVERRQLGVLDPFRAEMVRQEQEAAGNGGGDA